MWLEELKAKGGRNLPGKPTTSSCTLQLKNIVDRLRFRSVIARGRLCFSIWSQDFRQIVDSRYSERIFFARNPIQANLLLLLINKMSKISLDNISAWSKISAIDSRPLPINPATKPLTLWGVRWEGGVTKKWSCETSKGLMISLWGYLPVSSLLNQAF